jgi:DNA-binding LacI/PurR family transcriptional regulator
MPDRVTLQDVADRAGVDRSTASYALSGTGRVSQATRERVRRIAGELDYHVNVGARNLRRSRTGAIALYLPDVATGFAYYMDVAFGVIDRAREVGLNVTLLSTSSELDQVSNAHVDGFIVIDPYDDDPTIARVLKQSRPVVSGELTSAALPTPAGTLTLHHAEAITQLLEHLHAQGCRAPAMIAVEMRTAWGRTMRNTFESWCLQHGVAPRVHEVRAGTPAELAEAEAALLDVGTPADAIIVMPDGAAVGVVSAAQARGLQVGRDLLVASCVDGTVLRLFDPAITALDLHSRDFGRACATMLLEILAEPASEAVDRPPRLEFQPIDLMIRSSTQRL